MTEAKWKVWVEQTYVKPRDFPEPREGEYVWIKAEKVAREGQAGPPECAELGRQRTPASFKCVTLNESTFVDGWIYGGIIEEVSLLQREKPAEPGA
jgi:hypothetical protein